MASDSRRDNLTQYFPENDKAVRRAGIGLIVAATGTALQFTQVADPAALVIGIFGLLISGFAIASRPSDSRILGLASLTAIAAVFATSPEWGAVRMMIAVMAAVAAVAAILFLMSRTARRVVVSLLLLFHFAGVLSAITSPPPTPWLTSQAWVRIFRPHLEFCYVNNAYQFYSPEPGPANLLWFCIIGEDKQVRWVKIPGSHENYDPLGVQYYRRLSITERANGNEQFPAGPPPEALLRRKEVLDVIPFHPEAAPSMQFRMPDENSRQFLASYARHVAAHYGSGRPGVPIKSIKIYLTQHRLLDRQQYAARVDPYDKASYLPFFVGDFDVNGNMLNPFDPMLYWVVPIIKSPKIDPQTGGVIPGQFEYTNYLNVQAGSDPFEAP